MLKRFVVANRFYVEVNPSTKEVFIYMKDDLSAKLPGIDKFALGQRILEDQIKTYKHITVHKKEKSRYPGVGKAVMIEIVLSSGHIYRIFRDGVLRGTPI